MVTLAACGDDKDDSSKASETPAASAPQETAAPSPKIVDGPVPAITAGTKFGQKPTVAKGSGEPSKDLAVKTVIAGGGKVVAENDYIQAHYLAQVWDTAKVFANSYDAKTAALVPLAQGRIYEGWRFGLAGKKVGSRVEMAVPPAWGYGKEGNAQAGVKGTDTLVFVIDIEDTFNAQSSAKGDVVAQDNVDLPKVGTNTDGKAPSIDIPKTDPPKKLVANYVIEGDGEEVAAENSVLVQYKGVQWAGGKEFDSTYANKQLASFSLQGVVKGWTQGLAGKKVGSRVLTVIPPELGYGDNPPQGSGIAKGATLVFTVDILAKM
jgi:peptidylprolyl isomerase